MSRASFGTRLHQVLGALAFQNQHKEGRRKACRYPRVEFLEDRALLTTVTVDVVNFAFSPSAVTIHVGRHGPLGLADEQSQHDFGGG